MNKNLIWLVVIVAVVGVVVLIPKQQPAVQGDQEIVTFNPEQLKIGDVVAGMKVTEFGPAKENLPISFNATYETGEPILNYKVVFGGEKILRGTYDSFSEMNGGRYLTLDEQSEASLPRPYNAMDIYGDSGVPALGIADLPGLGEAGTLEIEISDLQFIAYPADFGGYSATVKRVINYQPQQQ